MNETISEIIGEIRQRASFAHSYGDDSVIGDEGLPKLLWDYADRIEAAAKRRKRGCEMRDGLYLKMGKKLYKLHSHAKCSKHTCSLFVHGICDDAQAWIENTPCQKAEAMIIEVGLEQRYGVNYKEVKIGKGSEVAK